MIADVSLRQVGLENVPDKRKHKFDGIFLHGSLSSHVQNVRFLISYEESPFKTISSSGCL
jgi:hypothetical protein